MPRDPNNPDSENDGIEDDESDTDIQEPWIHPESNEESSSGTHSDDSGVVPSYHPRDESAFLSDVLIISFRDDQISVRDPNALERRDITDVIIFIKLELNPEFGTFYGNLDTLNFDRQREIIEYLISKYSNDEKFTLNPELEKSVGELDEQKVLIPIADMVNRIKSKTIVAEKYPSELNEIRLSILDSLKKLVSEIKEAEENDNTYVNEFRQIIRREAQYAELEKKVETSASANASSSSKFKEACKELKEQIETYFNNRADRKANLKRQDLIAKSFIDIAELRNEEIPEDQKVKKLIVLLKSYVEAAKKDHYGVMHGLGKFKPTKSHLARAYENVMKKFPADLVKSELESKEPSKTPLDGSQKFSINKPRRKKM